MRIHLNRFDLTTLRLFVAAVDTGSLTSGAERLDISLAAASKRIAELEAHVGTPLLERSKRGVVPTDSGLTLMPHAIELVARLEQLALAMGDVTRSTGGHLRLWANTSAFGGFLPALLARFARAHPGVVFDLEDAISEDAVRAVARGTAELAVIGENTAAEGLQTLVCHTDELVLMLPASHALLAADQDRAPGAAAGAGAGVGAVASAATPIPLRTVLAHDLVAFGRATSLTRQLAAAAEAARQPLRIRAQVRSFDAMARMVSAGLGLAVLPREGGVPYARALGLVLAPISGMRTERQLLLAMRDRELLSPAAQAFVRLAQT